MGTDTRMEQIEAQRAEARSKADKAQKFRTRLGVIAGGAVFLLVFGLLMFNSIFGWNEMHQTTAVTHVFGEQKIVFDSGYYYKGFGDTTTYNKVLPVPFVRTLNAKGQIVGSDTSIPVRFGDANRGGASGVARFKLPDNAKQFLLMHKEAGSMAGVQSVILYPAVVESAKSAARIMTAEDHYRGLAGQMSSDFSDQLLNGIFVTRKVDDVSGDGQDTEGGNIEKETVGKGFQTVVKKLDDEGNVVRKGNPLTQYGITLLKGSAITEVDYDDMVDARLDKQKALAAKKAEMKQQLLTEQQGRLTAEQTALKDKAVAEGEALKKKAVAIVQAQQAAETAKIQADREKQVAEIKAEREANVLKVNAQRDADVAKVNADRDKLVAEIAAAKKVTVAEQSKLEAQILKERADIEAKRLKVEAEARKIAAENAVDPKYRFDKELAAKVAIEKSKFDALGDIKLPSTVTVLGGGGQSGDVDLIKTLAPIALLKGINSNGGTLIPTK